MTKEDAISRAEALKIVDELNDGSSECANIRAEIEKLPSIQSKVKTGHWIKIQKTQKGCHDCTVITYEYHCSECDCINVSPYKKFCPNCGARMEGRTEE